MKKVMNKNDVLCLHITDISSSGAGVGKIDGIPVFVPQTAIDDIIKVKIVKVKKSLCFGKLLEIIEPSKDRVRIDCPHFEKCGGCTFRHISYGAEKRIKQNNVYNCIKRIGGISLKPEDIVCPGDTLRYRNKAQYPISADGKTGFYATHSHRVIPNDDCLLQPDEFSLAQRALEEWIVRANASIYNEETGKGLCRHLYLRKGFSSGDIMAVLVVNSDTIPHRELLIELLKSALGENLKSVCINVNTAKNNVVLGSKNIPIYKDDFITDTLCKVKVHLSPNSFYQVNSHMAQKLYEKAAEYAHPENKVVLDLYCGAGTIGLSMADAAKKIIGVEIVPDAVEDAKKNAQNLGLQNTEFICGDAAIAAKELRDRNISPDVIIVDPPRKGCEEKLLDIIAFEFSPESLVYVSCDPATLARDVALLKNKGYTLKEYTPFDLFPRTAHVETVALLVRTVSSI